MNAEDIRNVTFDKVMRGYRPEEVDAYLDQVAAELERLQTEKADAEKKMYILAEKVDQYRNDEETLKTALLNAQRMGESVIHEARQKAETIIYDATSKASQAREEAVEKVAEEEMLLARLKAEVAHFKGEVLNLYKQHIESLSMIPGAEEKKKKAPEAAEEVIGSAVAKTHKHYPDVEVCVSVPEELMMVPMDPLLIEQVLVNLINNAIKYTPEHSRIELFAAPEGKFVRICVTDDGPGIPEESRDKLFDMFYTLGKTRSDGRRGLGLGLALCRSIVAAHGGVINVQNAAPHGACFRFTLPRTEVTLYE